MVSIVFRVRNASPQSSDQANALPFRVRSCSGAATLENPRNETSIVPAQAEETPHISQLLGVGQFCTASSFFGSVDTPWSDTM